DRRTRRKRTAKSCGSSAAVLALSPREAKLLGGDGGKRAVLREEHEVSRKATAQGRPECSRCPVCSCAFLFAQIARETAGAASTRSSLRPLISRRANQDANLGRNAPRDRETNIHVIASEAKQSIATSRTERWIASRSLSSGAHSRDPLARNDGREVARETEEPVARMSAAISGEGIGRILCRYRSRHRSWYAWPSSSTLPCDANP